VEIKDTLSVDSLGLLLALVWPGWLAGRTYGHLMPTRQLEWKDAVTEGVFFSAINYIVFFPAVLFVLRGENIEAHPWSYWGCIALLLLIGPVLLAVTYRQSFRWNWLAKRIQAPYPTAWDYFFDKREQCFVLAHLKNGAMVGGFWGAGSYASSFPRDGDLYISTACSVDQNGVFIKVVDRTKGILLRKEQYTYLEFFAASAPSKPQPGVTNDGQGESEAAAPGAT
jgi:hypothetical protein